MRESGNGRMFCRPGITCGHDSQIRRRLQFRPAGEELEYDCDILPSRTEGPCRAFQITYPYDPRRDSLQWFGGTYAAHPQLFPRRQCTAKWWRDHILPLGIAPPARFDKFMHFHRKRWLCRADPTGEVLKIFPGFDSIRQPLLRPADIERAWRKKYDWFTAVPGFYVPDSQTAAGRDIAMFAAAFAEPSQHDDKELPVVRHPHDAPGTVSTANKAFVKSLSQRRVSRIRDRQLVVWTP